MSSRAGPKVCQLKVGDRRSPRLLVTNDRNIPPKYRQILRNMDKYTDRWRLAMTVRLRAGKVGAGQPGALLIIQYHDDDDDDDDDDADIDDDCQ